MNLFTLKEKIIPGRSHTSFDIKTHSLQQTNNFKLIFYITSRHEVGFFIHHKQRKELKVKNIKHFGVNFLLVAICVLAYIFSPVAIPFIIGGVITQGILGGFAGKVGKLSAESGRISITCAVM